jgi:hypothetical protein
MPSIRDYKDKDGNEDLVAFEMGVFAWNEDYKGMRVRKDRYRDTESNAWALIYNQCSAELKKKLKGAEGCEKAKENNNIVQLLKMIRNYCCQFDTLNNEYVSVWAHSRTCSSLGISQTKPMQITMKILWHW